MGVARGESSLHLCPRRLCRARRWPGRRPSALLAGQKTGWLCTTLARRAPLLPPSCTLLLLACPTLLLAHAPEARRPAPRCCAGEQLHNSAMLVAPDGTFAGVARKTALSANDERWATAATGAASMPVFETPRFRLGVGVCKDVSAVQEGAAPGEHALDAGFRRARVDVIAVLAAVGPPRCLTRAPPHPRAASHARRLLAAVDLLACCCVECCRAVAGPPLRICAPLREDNTLHAPPAQWDSVDAPHVIHDKWRARLNAHAGSRTLLAVADQSGGELGTPFGGASVLMDLAEPAPLAQ
eukprot:6758615-Prymnesium_polylepis.1